MTFKQVDRDKKEEILKFNFEKHEEGLTFVEIQKMIKKQYDVDVSSYTLSKRYVKECKKIGRENVIDGRRRENRDTVVKEMRVLRENGNSYEDIKAKIKEKYGFDYSMSSVRSLISSKKIRR